MRDFDSSQHICEDKWDGGFTILGKKDYKLDVGIFIFLPHLLIDFAAASL